ncbi:hypothetical protein KNE206_50280 [Kitasatospora sp. NE20-6]|uniref:hypothetical protein n=1 Tax=Kitasatospora sp. NE20-6 TaxID=2859066 RepID=UPI0034DC8DA5
MRIRPAATAALLVAVSFGAAACGPESSGDGTAAAGSSPAAAVPSAAASEPAADPATSAAGTPAADAASAAPVASAEPDNGGRGPNCKTYFRTHKVIHVKSVDQASGKLTADIAEPNCSPNGLFLNPTEKYRTYTVSPDARVTVFTTEALATKTVTVKAGTAGDGLAHVKTCAETKFLDGSEELPAGYFCYQNTYEFTVDAKGAVTSLKETWSS